MSKPDRLLYNLSIDESLPTIIFFCCIHGNERAGYEALQSVTDFIEKNKKSAKGNFYAIFGNKEAYLQNQRFINKDLNRIWTKSYIEESTRKAPLVSEYNDLIEIYNTLHNILKDKKGPVYCLDLHTTSGPTRPFIVMNDSIKNRDFVKNLGYPVIFNIESFIEGALLNMLNDLGHVSFGFEAGEHTSKESVREFKIFCYRVISNLGLIDNQAFIDKGIEKYVKFKEAKYFEIVFRQNLQSSDTFEMIGNFLNFQKLKKGDRIAMLNGKLITAPENYQIFMPLYQKKGEDGFFYIQKISNFKLKVAKFIRLLGLEQILTILPGIQKINNYTLSIPSALIRFIPKRLLFALGYRKSVEMQGNKLYFTKQERKISKLPKIKSFVSPYKYNE
jgi:succinylglutamate desuccinylase